MKNPHVPREVLIRGWRNLGARSEALAREQLGLQLANWDHDRAKVMRRLPLFEVALDGFAALAAVPGPPPRKKTSGWRRRT